MHPFILVTYSMNTPLQDTRTRSPSEPIKDPCTGTSTPYEATPRSKAMWINGRTDEWLSKVQMIFHFYLASVDASKSIAADSLLVVLFSFVTPNPPGSPSSKWYLPCSIIIRFVTMSKYSPKRLKGNFLSLYPIRPSSRSVRPGAIVAPRRLPKSSFINKRSTPAGWRGT